jgi:hypothetical protein
MSISCFLREKDTLTCGPSCGKEKLTLLVQCRDDIKSHLATYHLSWESVSEYELILVRSELFSLSEQQIGQLWICPMHRHRLGKFWKESKMTCQHPKHCGEKKQVKEEIQLVFKWQKK